ncbi:MAG: heme exporter protein CcmD [Candidatus Dactylopiibacterium sp.]|nr:heme exporter protein CcmD [Candidatus Dactylopiibacterium sp.]
MHWQSVSEFLAMGGRGAFVWGSYGVGLGLIALELWLLRRRQRSSLRRLSRLQQLERQKDRP